MLLGELGDAKLPTSLEPGRSASVGVDLRGLAQNLAEVGIPSPVSMQGFVRDELGHEYLSPQSPWDYQDFL